MTTSHLEARFIQPMKRLAVRRLPEGEGWEYELKLDGCRTSAVKHGGRLTLFPRNRDIAWIRAKEAVVRKDLLTRRDAMHGSAAAASVQDLDS